MATLKPSLGCANPVVRGSSYPYGLKGTACVAVAQAWSISSSG